MVAIYCYIDTLSSFVSNPLDLEVFCSFEDLIHHPLRIAILGRNLRLRERIVLALMQWSK